MTMELRRGVIVLAILSLLEREHYGYSLREILASSGLEVNEGTLYPLLRRLESQGLLSSEWRTGSGRPRKYYRISGGGRKVLGEMKREWRDLVAAMAHITGSDSTEE